MFRKKIEWFCIFVIVFYTIVLVSYYLLNIDRGFNLLDEGFYLLSGANPIDSRQQFTASHYYLHLLMMINNNIIFLRLFTFIIHFFAIALLISSFSYILEIDITARKRNKLVMFFSTLSIFSLSWIYPTEPNYNNLTIFGALIFYSLLVYYVTNQTSKYRSAVVFTLGFIATFVFFNKFTTGLFLLFIALISSVLMSYRQRTFKWLDTFFLVLGVLLHGFIFFYFMQSTHDYFTLTKVGLELMRLSGHSSHLLLQYSYQILYFIYYTLCKYQIIIYVSILICILDKYTSFRQFNLIRSKKIIYINFVLYLLLSFKYRDVEIIDITSLLFTAIIGLLLTNLMYNNSYKKFNIRITSKLLLILFLFCLPILIAVGSNNAIYNQVVLGLFLWMPIIVLLSLNTAKIINPVFRYLPILCIILLVGYYSLLNLRNKPYGLYGSLDKQTYPTEVNTSTLLLDKTTKYIIENTRMELLKCGFKTDDYLISLTDVPGLTYAVHARSPYCPWYLGLFGHDGEFVTKCLSLSPQIIGNAFVLLDQFKGQNAGFNESQLVYYFKDFNLKYKLCGEVKNIPTTGGSCCKAKIYNIKIYKPI